MARYLTADERQHEEKVSARADGVPHEHRGEGDRRPQGLAGGARDPGPRPQPHRLQRRARAARKLTEPEIESFAGMKGVSSEVLRAIGGNKDWTKRYGVVAEPGEEPAHAAPDRPQHGPAPQPARPEDASPSTATSRRSSASTPRSSSAARGGRRRRREALTDGQLLRAPGHREVGHHGRHPQGLRQAGPRATSRPLPRSRGEADARSSPSRRSPPRSTRCPTTAGRAEYDQSLEAPPRPPVPEEIARDAFERGQKLYEAKNFFDAVELLRDRRGPRAAGGALPRRPRAAPWPATRTGCARASSPWRRRSQLAPRQRGLPRRARRAPGRAGAAHPRAQGRGSRAAPRPAARDRAQGHGRRWARTSRPRRRRRRDQGPAAPQAMTGALA